MTGMLPGRAGLAPLAAVLCAACAATPVAFTDRPVDWALAPVVRIRNLPDNVVVTHDRLQVGRPARVIVINGFGPTADFVSTFFRTVRYRPGSPNTTLTLRIDPAQQVELDVIPQQAGTYAFSVIGYGVPNQPVIGDITVTP